MRPGKKKPESRLRRDDNGSKFYAWEINHQSVINLVTAGNKNTQSKCKFSQTIFEITYKWLTDNVQGTTKVL
jgi:hypothetical protein